jgi:hypothetical protein
MRDLRDVELAKTAGNPQFLQDGKTQIRAKEQIMNQIELNQQSRELLERVRHRKVLSLFDMPSDLAEAAV